MTADATAVRPGPSGTPEDPRLMLPIAEAAAKLGVSVKHLKRHGAARQIGQKWLVPVAYVDFMAAWPSPEAAT